MRSRAGANALPRRLTGEHLFGDPILSPPRGRALLPLPIGPGRIDEATHQLAHPEIIFRDIDKNRTRYYVYF
jgi:hypothetical protein